MAILIRPIAAALLALGLSASPAPAVFGGKTVVPVDVVAKSVAALLSQDSTGVHLCTAIALSPRLMLTAAHCTDGGAGGLRLIFDVSLVDVPEERLRGVKSVSRAKPTAESKGTYPYNNPDDIALIVLDAPAPAGTRFMGLTQGNGTGAVGIAGYGATSDLRKAASGKTQLGFDRSLRAARTSLASKGAALIADQTGGAGMCTGDSGGPAFTLNGKSLSLAGVLIGVSSPRNVNDYCRGSAHYVSIARWRDWIVATAKALGQPLP
ncbi:MAG: trypsin-like serine protease [Devosia sp.]